MDSNLERERGSGSAGSEDAMTSTYMPPIYVYQHPGEDGGTWYAAQYPLGATRYYISEEARDKATSAYIAATGGTGRTLIIDNQQR